jgi:hypothetical protein
MTTRPYKVKGTKMDFYSTAVAYFDAFSNKDLGRLEELYAKNIYLRDWEGTYVGAMPVLKANKELFDNVDTIIVRPVVLHFDVDDNSISAEIEIMISDMDPFLAVDIIEFNSSGKILAIRAYKG